MRLERWLSAALRTQARLARSLPLCYAHLLGTHNSGITLADGYGNLDPYYQSFLSYIKWAADVGDARLRTNDQWLSLTDQLEMGVRSVELDTHWIGVRAERSSRTRSGWVGGLAARKAVCCGPRQLLAGPLHPHCPRTHAALSNQECPRQMQLPTQRKRPTPCRCAQGSLRIAHCGGLHVPELNALVRALNLVARLLHRRIRWDTETLGCVPSLSSIPAMEQRTLRDALREIREWMDRVRGY